MEHFLGSEEAHKARSSNLESKEEIEKMLQEEKGWLTEVNEWVEFTNHHIEWIKFKIENHDSNFEKPEQLKEFENELVKTQEQLKEEIALRDEIASLVSELELDKIDHEILEKQLEEIQEKYCDMMTKRKPGQEN